jgi:hypothetical protein
MAINWDLAARIAAPALSGLVSFAVGRWSERRPRLVVYLPYASAFVVPVEGRPPMGVHTHAVVIRNVGRRTATNIRVPHFFLPDSYTLWPAVAFRVEDVPNAGRDIVIPSLVEGQQVTINYLYGPPVLAENVTDTARIRSDEGFARVITVLPTPLPSLWKVRLIQALTLTGFVASLYIAVSGVMALLRMLA